MTWVENEIKTINLGDARIDARMEKILNELGDKPSYSIPQACGSWGETIAAYRFFDNSKVNFDNVLACHKQATLERIKTQKVVLLPQDTTELIHVKTKEAKAGLGTIKATEKEEIFLHPVLAITPNKVPLGIVFATYWQRTEKCIKAEQRKKPIAEKESIRWIEGYQAACEVQKQTPNTIIVSLADREGDIYEMFVEMNNYQPEERAAWIIRCAQNRILENEAEEERKIRQKIETATVLGTTSFTMPASGSRKVREVVQTLRTATVILKPPQRAKATDALPTISINIVYAKEENPPVGETPISWILLTCLPVATFAQAQLVVEWYLARWEIEIYFRVLKQGCTVEELQFAEAKRFAACLAIYMIIAWRVLYITMLGRDYPNINCEAIFNKEEWQTLYVMVKGEPAPTETPALLPMIMMLASFGGFLERKHDKFPGAKSIWMGLQRLNDFIWAIQRYQASCSSIKPKRTRRITASG
jgi:hypothetical protein